MKKLIAIFIALSLLLPTVSFAQELSERIIHVSPSGSDLNDGSVNKPLASLDGARLLVRKLSKKQPITVLFHEGEYKFNKAVTFTLDDSGTEDYPIIYKAAEGEKVVFSGGTELDVSKFTPVTDEKILARLPESSKDKVGQLDLKAQGITKVRNIKLNRSNEPEGYISLIVDDKDQPLSQWPNGETNYAQYEDIVSAGSVASSSNPGKGGTFKYSELNPSKWADAPDAFAAGYFGYDYRYEMNAISKINSKTKEITLSTGSDFGIINEESRRWKAFNLLEEIDMPGEWYIDRAKLILYYYPAYPLKNSKMELTTLEDNFINSNEASYIRIKGITFTQTQENAIELTNKTNDFDIINCNFKFISKKGVQANPTVRGNVLETYTPNFVDQVSNCDIIDNTFYYLGSSAVNLYSGIRDTLTDGNCHISNNDISHVQRYTYTQPAINISGVGNYVENNLIHNLPFHAINFSGNENKIRYNECYNVGREAYDAAVLYTGRSFIRRGNEVAYNFVHDYLRKDEKIGYDVVGMFLDDQISGTIVHNNIFVNGAAGIQVGGGHHTLVDSNIVINMKDNVFNTDNRGETWSVDYTNNLIKDLVNITKNPYYIAKYPELAESVTNPKAPLSNKITNNLANKAMTYNARMKELGTIENNIAVSDLSDFVDPNNNDFRVKSDSKIAQELPNIITDKNFDMSQIGLQINENIKNIESPNDKNASFRKLYPQNGTTNVNGANCYLYWEPAPEADEYRIKVATDSNMENIILDEKSNFNYFTVTSLSSGYSTYYWTVEAINISRQKASTWKSSGVPFMFTTSKYDVLDKAVMKETLSKAQEIYDSLVEGNNVGQYKIGTKSMLKDAIAEATTYYSLRQGQTSQSILDSQVENLKRVMTEASNNLKIGYKGIDYMLTSADDWLETTADMTVENGTLNYVSKTGTALAYAKTQPSKSEIQCFKAKFKFNSNDTWIGLVQRQPDATNPVWSSQGYLVVIKPAQIELQKFPGGMIETVANSAIPNDTWVDVQWGTIDVMNGVRLILKINGKTIFDYIDNSAYIENNGSFGFMSSGDAEVSLMNPEQIPTGDETYEYLKPRVVSVSDYIADSQNWKASKGNVKVENDTVNYVSEDAETSMGYDVLLKGDEVVNMDVKFNYGDSWQAFAVRTSDINVTPWSINDYLVVVKKNTIELQRFNKGKNEMLSIIDNDYISEGEFVNIKFGAVETENGTRLLLYVNNNMIFDLMDINALTDTGKLAFYDVSKGGMEIKEPSLGEITIPDFYFNNEKGITFANTDSGLTTSGTWGSGKVGYEGKTIKVGKPGAASTWGLNVPPGIYKVYYWVGVDLEGDPNANLEVYASGEAQSRNIKINMSRGEAGWRYVGTSYPSDGVMALNLTGSGTGNLLISAVKVVKADLQELSFSNIFENCKNAVVLKLNSTTAFADRKELVIPKAPESVNDRTMVPIRFITEAFGANVSWDGTTSTATVNISGRTLKFTENSTKYVIDNVEKELEQPTVIINDTMMLPIRVISEDVGKNVFWDESGLIIIADNEIKIENDMIQAALSKFASKGDK